jgi:hypothetical protein
MLIGLEKRVGHTFPPSAHNSCLRDPMGLATEDMLSQRILTTSAMVASSAFARAWDNNGYYENDSSPPILVKSHTPHAKGNGCPTSFRMEKPIENIVEKASES